jgi:hypothetical protein
MFIFAIGFGSSSCSSRDYTIQIDSYRYKKSISKKFLESIKKHGHTYNIVRQNGRYRLLVGCYKSKQLAIKDLKKTRTNTCRYKAYVTRFKHKTRRKKRAEKMKTVMMNKPNMQQVSFKRDKIMGLAGDDAIDLSTCETNDIFSEAKGYSKDPY